MIKPSRKAKLSGRFFLLGAENPVAGIAQAGDDIGVLVQPLIQGSQVDFHIVTNVYP